MSDFFCVIIWTVPLQAPLSMGGILQRYCNGFPFPTQGHLPNPEIEPVTFTSPAWAGGFFTTSTTREALYLKPLVLSFYVHGYVNPCLYHSALPHMPKIMNALYIGAYSGLINVPDT